MKNTFLVLVTIVAFCVTGFGQISTKLISQGEDSKSLFEQTAGLIDVTKPDVAKRQVEENMENSKGSNFGPGDHPVFLLSSNAEYVRRGEFLELNLVPMINSNRTYQVGFQYLKPGNTGEYDGTQPLEYFSAEVGSYGDIHGIQTLTPIRIHSRQLSQGDPFGRHTFSIAIWDEQGILVQQILLDVYLVDAGVWGPWFRIDKINPFNAGYTLTGKFPTGVPVYYMIGVPRYGSLITGPDPQYAAHASANGTKVVLSGNIQFSKTTAIDIMMWAPFTRYAIVKPKGIVQINLPQN